MSFDLKSGYMGYSFFIDMIWMVLVSGIADGLMGLVLLVFMMQIKKTLPENREF